MLVENNTPSAGFISWSNVRIQYYGEVYEIADNNTDFRFVYWKFSDPTSFYGSNEYPQLEPDDLMVFLNRSGIHLKVPSTTIMDGSLIVPESILADAIAANQINADHIVAGTISATQIAAGAIGAEQIEAGAVNADKMNVTDLSAISANIGTITAGTINGIQINSANISIDEDVRVGDNIYLGDVEDALTAKHIYFNESSSINANETGMALLTGALELKATGFYTLAAGQEVYPGKTSFISADPQYDTGAINYSADVGHIFTGDVQINDQTKINKGIGEPSLHVTNTFSTTDGLAAILGESSVSGKAYLGYRHVWNRSAAVYGIAGTNSYSRAGYFDGDVEVTEDLIWNNSKIIQRGSNANGHYIRYADGTQICWYRSTSFIEAPNAAGAVYWGASDTMNYPVAFNGAPTVTGFGRRRTQLTWSGLRNADHTGLQIYVISVSSSGSAYPEYIAVGRW